MINYNIFLENFFNSPYTEKTFLIISIILILFIFIRRECFLLKQYKNKGYFVFYSFFDYGIYDGKEKIKIYNSLEFVLWNVCFIIISILEYLVILTFGLFIFLTLTVLCFLIINSFDYKQVLLFIKNSCIIILTLVILYSIKLKLYNKYIVPANNKKIKKGRKK
jgi:hypothetical protein